MLDGTKMLLRGKRKTFSIFSIVLIPRKPCISATFQRDADARAWMERDSILCQVADYDVAFINIVQDLRFAIFVMYDKRFWISGFLEFCVLRYSPTFLFLIY